MLQPPVSPTVSVVVPARNEEATVGAIVAALVASDPRLEVVVVDDGSSDATAAVAESAGAVVVDAGAPLPGCGPGPGKGRAMWAGLAGSTGEVVVFCDADLAPFDPTYVGRLVGCLVATPGAELAKGAYERMGTGGRVNELVARPAIELLHPQVAHVDQPLGGEYAGWRRSLAQLPFVCSYGVDLGLVLDVAGLFGPRSVVQVDLGARRHRNRTLGELRPQAREVLEVALHRAGHLDRSPRACPPLASLAGAQARGVNGVPGAPPPAAVPGPSGGSSW